MVAIAATCRKALVNARWATPLLLCTNGFKKHYFHLVGAPFLTFWAAFSPEGATVKAGMQERGTERGMEVRCKVRRK